MKIMASICIMILIISGCGKKSEPKYEGKKSQLRITI
tara:strand:+ start:1023 stop:1133 length:111 start_codon:yes stop_codon:yes gene_type:complete